MPINSDNIHVKKIVNKFLSNNPPPIHSTNLEFAKTQSTVFIGLAMSGLQFDMEHLKYLYSDKKYQNALYMLKFNNDSNQITCGIHNDNSIVFYPANPKNRTIYNTVALKLSDLYPKNITKFILNVTKTPEFISDCSLSKQESLKVINYLNTVFDFIKYKHSKMLKEMNSGKLMPDDPNREFDIVCNARIMRDEEKTNYVKGLLEVIADNLNPQKIPQLFNLLFNTPAGYDLRSRIQNFAYKYQDETFKFVANEDASLSIHVVDENGRKDTICIKQKELPYLSDLGNFIADNINLEHMLKIGNPVVVENFEIKYLKPTTQIGNLINNSSLKQEELAQNPIKEQDLDDKEMDL